MTVVRASVKDLRLLPRASRVLVAVVAVALAAGCGAADQASPAATPKLDVATAPPPDSPSPTATIDVATVPATIDEAYLEAVMAVLNAKLAGVMRRAQQSGELDEEFQAGMRALYSAEAANAQVVGFREAVGIEGLATPPRPPTTDVQQIIEATSTCVYLTAAYDLQPMLAVHLEVEQPYYVGFERNHPNDRNPTAWKIGMSTFYRETEAARPPTNVCRSP